ncbi:MAG: hypothetical protein GX076_07945 [Clostridiales bacterium]|jgi:hypothetical protein|nr:hypothetical protein [Clostridiales bacterium]
MNTITISNDLLNKELKDTILSYAKPYVEDFHIEFKEGYIFLDLYLQVKALGPILAKYRLKVLDFNFNSLEHTLKLSYSETVKSTGNVAQSMMVKLIGLRSQTFLQTAVEMLNRPAIRANDKSCSIDLEQLINIPDVLSMLNIKYIDSRDDCLQLSFGIDI